MKNIHVIPTKLASEYYLTKEGVLEQSYSLRRGGAVHVYITDNSEIKKGDWFITTDTNEIYKSDWIKFHFNNGKKIILTSDQDLIKDSVQKIDDEFLEWFVKNPNCQEVEAEKKSYIEIEEVSYEGDFQDVEYTDYKIIIPNEIGFKVENGKKTETFYSKEEPKQVELLGGIEKGKRYVVVGEPKKETLEEAAENYKNQWLDEIGDTINTLDIQTIFKTGAKWQQERSYSDEEILKSADKLTFKQITSEELNSLPYQPFITDEDGNIWVINIKEFKKK